jgi:triphosphoribosyl-dephospho-CoA synthase
LDREDAIDVYRAIRLAHPGGLGKVEAWDVAGEPPDRLLEAMNMAASRDTIARQYVNGFQQVFEEVVPRLERATELAPSLDQAIVLAHVQTMAATPDSLIERKCGAEAARESAERAAEVLRFPLGDPQYTAALTRLDDWLRGDGNRRNPGTTADLIGAGLFVALRNGIIQLPVR